MARPVRILPITVEQRGGRMVPHFTPASGSWMNLVERFFRDLTEEVAGGGGFTSVAELVGAIDDYLAHRNQVPKRFVWNAKGRDILAKINRPRAAFDQPQHTV